MEERRNRGHVPANGGWGKRHCSSSRRGRCRDRCAGDLNRVINAESANLQRAVAAAARQLEAVDTLDADGRLAKQPYVVRLVADARREVPEATSHRAGGATAGASVGGSAALERIERLALHADEGIGRRRPVAVAERIRLTSAQGPSGRDPKDRPPSGARRRVLASLRDMRPVIIAANWKMNTTPADAGELAATIAARTEEPEVVRVICPP